MEPIRFFVFGAPRGKARARVVRGHSYTPDTTVQAERAIAWEAKKCMEGRPPLEGPVWLQIEARYRHPASWSAKKKAATIWKTTKPDRDNIEKLVSDALNGICWIDDAQVCDGKTSKRYIRKLEEEGLYIEIGNMT